MKVIIFQEKLPHYRVEVFNELASFSNIDELTIIHTDKEKLNEKFLFKQVLVNVSHFGKFRYIKGFKDMIKEADRIVLMFDLRWLNVLQFIFSDLRNKIILWGIGISTKNGLRKKRILDTFRFFIVSRYKAVILYSNYVADYYKNHGVKESKIFIANNTLKVKKKPLNTKKPRNLLFIGTINERKKIDDLIDAFVNILPKIDEAIFLHIVGDGPLLTKYKNYVSKMNKSDKIIFHGRVETQEKLEHLFQEVCLSISLGQAGLSVLHSLSFGVPFISYKDAINGGEIENIIQNSTGILTTKENLEKDLLFLLNSDDVLEEMSKKSYDHYWNSRTIDHFVKNYTKSFL